jgi:hypothetical protein
MFYDILSSRPLIYNLLNYDIMGILHKEKNLYNEETPVDRQPGQL